KRKSGFRRLAVHVVLESNNIWPSCMYNTAYFFRFLKFFGSHTSIVRASTNFELNCSYRIKLPLILGVCIGVWDKDKKGIVINRKKIKLGVYKLMTVFLFMKY
ncbi:MAG: hypothetical protein ACOVP1_08400, partial [Bacteroidia bacterium]